MFTITICCTSVGTAKMLFTKNSRFDPIFFMSKVIKEYNKFMGTIDFLDQKLNKDEIFLLKTICQLFGS